jgi:hypothetical protein
MPKHKRKHEHDHPHKGKHPVGNGRRQPSKKGLHQDWRTWTVVVLMIVGMVAYVFSLDESLRPFGGQESEVPVAEIAE